MVYIDAWWKMVMLTLKTKETKDMKLPEDVNLM